MIRPTQERITLNYGVKDNLHPSGHNGVDFSGKGDRNVYAPESGTLAFEYQPGLGGNVLILRNGNREHKLAHLSSMVKKSGSVSQGQKIAVMGQTGLATAVHLHWGVLVNGKYVNPLTLVSGGGNTNDMYDGKTAEQWYAVANDWHVRADDRQKVIVKLENEVQDLKSKITTTPTVLNKGIYQVKG